MDKVTLELNLERDRLVNVVSTEPVGSQEQHEQSATDLVRAGRCKRARRRYFDHHLEEHAQHHLPTSVCIQSDILVFIYVTIKVSTRNHNVSLSKIIVTDQYSGSAFYPRQRDISVITERTIMSNCGQTIREPLG